MGDLPAAPRHVGLELAPGTEGGGVSPVPSHSLPTPALTGGRKSLTAAFFFSLDCFFFFLVSKKLFLSAARPPAAKQCAGPNPPRRPPAPRSASPSCSAAVPRAGLFHQVINQAGALSRMKKDPTGMVSLFPRAGGVG